MSRVSVTSAMELETLNIAMDGVENVVENMAARGKSVEERKADICRSSAKSRELKTVMKS